MSGFPRVPSASDVARHAIKECRDKLTAELSRRIQRPAPVPVHRGDQDGRGDLRP